MSSDEFKIILENIHDSLKDNRDEHKEVFKLVSRIVANQKVTSAELKEMKKDISEIETDNEKRDVDIGSNKILLKTREDQLKVLIYIYAPIFSLAGLAGLMRYFGVF